MYFKKLKLLDRVVEKNRVLWHDTNGLSDGRLLDTPNVLAV